MSSPEVLGLCPYSTLFQAFPEAALWFCFHLLSIPLLLLSASIQPLPPAERPSQHTTNLKVCPILTFRSKYFPIEVWIIKWSCAQHFYEEQIWLIILLGNHGSLMIIHSLLYLSLIYIVLIILWSVNCPKRAYSGSLLIQLKLKTISSLRAFFLSFFFFNWMICCIWILIIAVFKLIFT